MKVVVLTDQEITKEIQGKLNGRDLKLIPATSPQEAMNEEDVDAYFDLEFVPEKNRIEILSRFLPKPVFVNAVIHTLDEMGQPFIRINAWPTFLKRDICEIALQPGISADSAKAFLESMNWKYQVVPDLPGMISARIVAMIINEAYYTTQENVSTRLNIDTAMKLGTSYPYGPFEWSRLIGLKNIHALLLALRKTDNRYTISELLEKEAAIDGSIA